MKKLRASLGRLLSDDSGVTAIEYGLLSAAVGVILIGALLVVGSEMNSNFNTIATSFDGTKVGDDGAWPAGDEGPAKGKDSDSDTDAGGNGKSGGSGDGVTAEGDNGVETAHGQEAGGSPGGTGSVRGSNHAEAAWSSGRGTAVDVSGAASRAGPALDQTGQEDESSFAAVSEGSVAVGSYGGAVALLPSLDDGTGQSWALAPVKSVADAEEGTTGTAKDSEGSSNVSDDGLGWIGALILLLAFALIAANFRRAIRESERKRQVQEWQEAQAGTDNVAAHHAIKADVRKAA